MRSAPVGEGIVPYTMRNDLMRYHAAASEKGRPLKSREIRHDRRSLALPVLLIVMLTNVLGASVAGAGRLESMHDRPYFMPASERSRIQRLTTTHGWAHDELESVRALAKSDGYSAALLYVLQGNKSDLVTAKKWLMQYGMSGGDLGERALKADDVFFTQGQPWL